MTNVFKLPSVHTGVKATTTAVSAVGGYYGAQSAANRFPKLNTLVGQAATFGVGVGVTASANGNSFAASSLRGAGIGVAVHGLKQLVKAAIDKFIPAEKEITETGEVSALGRLKSNIMLDAPPIESGSTLLAGDLGFSGQAVETNLPFQISM